MALKLSEFKSNLVGGGAKSALFKVELQFPTVRDENGTLAVTTPPTKSEFLIQSASLPASTIATYDIFFQGKPIKVAADRTEATWDTTIINDENFGIRIALEEWSNSIANRDLNTRSKVFGEKFEGENASYKQDITVTQFGKDSSKLRKYKFKGSWPSAIGSVALGWENNAIETYTCTWIYDSWEIATL